MIEGWEEYLIFIQSFTISNPLIPILILFHHRHRDPRIYIDLDKKNGIPQPHNYLTRMN